MPSVRAILLAAFASMLLETTASSQEAKYADILDREALRQGVPTVSCPAETVDCTGSLVPKIINGRRADAGMFPWSVSVGKANATNFRGHLCGGTLISDRFILSAAHCFPDTARPEDYRIQMGTVELEGYTDKISIQRILIHKHFNRATNEADVSLLELNTPITPSASLNWIPIQDQAGFESSGHESSEARLQYTITGFGYIGPGKSPVRLQFSNDIPSLTTAECHELKVWDESIFGDTLKPGMICAGNTNNVYKSDACKGDSGGGLILPQPDNTQVVVGIVSRGALPDGSLDCTQQPLRVGVYTRVSTYASEISSCLDPGGTGCDFVAPGQQTAAVQD
ncbi:peptidase S1 and S6 chymotrypsin/Hap (plasmid) [Rhizobium leguminosarum bv. trifolii WSM1325]|uniref:Peptidase S1 and S6 chymotrypsin/Hap n=1 Tax=Rhizobium leguminosarum bv. trifolii (strain WSM1325) TaxID=395491 RepID=C6B8N5_RHILS|nr:serine protease [Rhizobium leguminosarum]ACS60273.1 peptidase S1 and S6 chymotrypsin/Hap [Rhizobium leguminosarum bv. trifolii WSM1325]